MTLARFTRPLLRSSGSFRAHPVSPALRLPFLLASLGLSIAMSRLPLSPPSCFFSTLRAAVTRQRMNGTKVSLASFQQTNPMARTSNFPYTGWSEMAVLIFLRSWTIFTRAHGRCLLPEAQASKGIALLFGALLCRMGRRYFTPRLNRPANPAYPALLVSETSNGGVGHFWGGSFLTSAQDRAEVISSDAVRQHRKGHETVITTIGHECLVISEGIQPSHRTRHTLLPRASPLRRRWRRRQNLHQHRVPPGQLLRLAG